MENSEPIRCCGCGSINVTVFYEPRYDGFRTRCSECESNWPET